MKYKIITILSLCLFLIGIVGSQIVYALTPTSLLSSALMVTDNGYVKVISQNSRALFYVDLSSYDSGYINISFNGGSPSGTLYCLSSSDTPNDINIGYTFISQEYGSITTQTYSIEFTGYDYIYISGNRTFTYTIDASQPDPTPGPSPSISPSPSPEVTPSLSPTPIPDDNGSNIPYHFDIPLDYYYVVIIILLGGILICQFFKK